MTPWSGRRDDTGRWTAYTPSMVAGAAGTGASFSGRYTRIGSTIHYEAVFALGVGFSFNSSTVFGIPAPASTISGYAPNIRVEFLDQGSAGYPGYGVLYSSGVSVFTLYVPGIGYPYHSTVSAAAPFPWVAGDAVIISGTYQAA